MSHWKNLVEGYSGRWDIARPGDKLQTLDFCAEQFVDLAKEAIQQQGKFSVALSGGSTPQAIYERLPSYREALDWKKVWLFWGDERSVPPDSPESNYEMAMRTGFSKLPIPSGNIHRMVAEDKIEENALAYDHLIQKNLGTSGFDLVMLGMGEDGHTASLFPLTHALHSQHRLVVANYVPQKSTWRMTLTYSCINTAKNIVIYVLGNSKQKVLQQVFDSPYIPDQLPIQAVGTPAHKALWIFDQEAAAALPK